MQSGTVKSKIQKSEEKSRDFSLRFEKYVIVSRYIPFMQKILQKSA